MYIKHFSLKDNVNWHSETVNIGNKCSDFTVTAKNHWHLQHLLKGFFEISPLLKKIPSFFFKLLSQNRMLSLNWLNMSFVWISFQKDLQSICRTMYTVLEISFDMILNMFCGISWLKNKNNKQIYQNVYTFGCSVDISVS